MKSTIADTIDTTIGGFRVRKSTGQIYIYSADHGGFVYRGQSSWQRRGETAPAFLARLMSDDE